MEIAIDPSQTRTLHLPGRVQLRLWRILEFGWPAIAVVIGFERGLVAQPGDQELIAAVIVTLLLSAIGGVFSCFSVFVSRSQICKEVGIIRSVYRDFALEEVGVPDFGKVTVVLDQHGEVTLRWWPLTWFGGGSHTRGIRREIKDCYGRNSPGTSGTAAPSIERAIIWWRLTLWVSIAALCPAPYLLGMLFAGS